MIAQVYHFSCTGRLPWILAAGQLQLGGNQTGGYPEPAFLWATTDHRGARSAASFVRQPNGRDGYREGKILRVRFTLAAQDFVPWREMAARYPTWTPAQIARLEQVGRELGDDPTTWCCRDDVLPLDHVLNIETRSYTGHQWRPLTELRLVHLDDGVKAVVLGDTAYLSQRWVFENAATRYAISARPASEIVS